MKEIEFSQNIGNVNFENLTGFLNFIVPFCMYEIVTYGTDLSVKTDYV
jgi:hypothetical protein